MDRGPNRQRYHHESTVRDAGWGRRSAADAPGFFRGLWHGFVAPIAFLISLFTDAVRVYAVPNLGRWYDFGFMLGIGGFSGGVFAGARKRG